ncbi:MAG: rhodanese-like domain-containing protein [Deltaproteobacteria bacterium]|nr:rhodanese-like domain-containing protein [Deltaproteobacteria bacterium]
MIKQISVEELKIKQTSEKLFYLFDVRTREEWSEGNIPGARLMLDVPSEELESLDKNADIVFQCRSGARSQRMAEEFEQKGFANLANLTGGILAWEQQS